MIPKIVHFIFGLNSEFGGKPFHLIHNIAIKSAHEIIRPDKIFIYCNHEPENNQYWNDIKSLVEIVKTEPPNEIFENPIEHYAHKADIIRLSKLIELGGIYLDIDTICINSFDNLLNNKFVMGIQQDRGLCNAIMMSEKNSDFCKLWFDTYRTFSIYEWDHHSVVTPMTLAIQYPDLITILATTAFFQPNFTEIDMIFDRFVDKSDDYACHLWESKSWDKYITHIDENWIRNSDSTYGYYAKKYI